MLAEQYSEPKRLFWKGFGGMGGPTKPARRVWTGLARQTSLWMYMTQILSAPTPAQSPWT